MKARIAPPIFCLLIAMLACGQWVQATPPPDRQASLPQDAVKVTPAEDAWPPAADGEWSTPRPLEGPVNSAGGEDSPFITLDGENFYFFFTPDVRIPAEQQVWDGVTGIWWAQRAAGTWSEPRRVYLTRGNEASLDGCEFVLDDLMVFCSVRAGNYREVDLYTAALRDGVWTGWQNWGEKINRGYEVGEMHITADRQELYFGSKRSGGYGGSDLWVSRWTGEEWGEPVNLGLGINSISDENRPFVTSDGQELWFDAPSRKGRPGPAIFMSRRQADGSWGAAQEIISTFAGEPTLTGDGRTLYFVHHFFSADLNQVIEADIYVTTRP